MDPISKALERASQDQQSVRGWVQPGRSESQPVPFLGARKPPRKVSLDRKLLHANRLLSGGPDEDPIVTDKYRLLRTRILQIMQARGWKSLGITSPSVKAGKTVTSINLALTIARQDDHRVVLVDADIRKPSVAKYMGIEGTAGLPDFLSGKLPVDDVLVEFEDQPRLAVMPGGHNWESGPTPEILKSSLIRDLMNSAWDHDSKTIFLVDLPPVLIGDDVISVAANLDALLIVVDESSTNIDDLKQTVELLSDFNLVGTVLNKSTEKPREHEGYYQNYRGKDARDSASPDEEQPGT